MTRGNQSFVNDASDACYIPIPMKYYSSAVRCCTFTYPVLMLSVG